MGADAGPVAVSSCGVPVRVDTLDGVLGAQGPPAKENASGELNVIVEKS